MKGATIKGSCWLLHDLVYSLITNLSVRKYRLASPSAHVTIRHLAQIPKGLSHNIIYEIQLLMDASVCQCVFQHLKIILDQSYPRRGSAVMLA